MSESDGDLPVIKFKECQVLTKDGQHYYIWPVNEETKSKIRTLLQNPELVIEFDATIESVPPHCCHTCGVEITLSDLVREAVLSGSHAKEFIATALEKPSIKGSSVPRRLVCENGHVSPLTSEWHFGPSWVYWPPARLR